MKEFDCFNHYVALNKHNFGMLNWSELKGEMNEPAVLVLHKYHCQLNVDSTVCSD